MTHAVIISGGSALAQPLIRHWLDLGWWVTAVCRNTIPNPELSDENLSVIQCVDLCTWIPQGRPSYIDVIVTMPGVVKNAKLTDMAGGDWQNVIDGNLTAVFNPLKHLIPRMNGNGNIVVVGSIVGSMGGYGCSNYAAAKAGLVGFVRAAANELAPEGKVINLLELGYVNAGMGENLDEKVRTRITNSIPLRRFAKPEEIIEPIQLLATTRYMTGNVVQFSGGLR